VLSAFDDSRKGSSHAVIFAVVTLSLLVLSIDSTMVATALHSVQIDLSTSLSWASWSLTGYALTNSVVLPVAARMCETFGNRAVFLVSVGSFGVCSFGCFLATSMPQLIAFRMVQGAVAAGIVPAATGIIVRSFAKNRDRAVGLFGSVFQTGTILGPVVGGIIVQALSWRWIFCINVPIAAILYLVARIILPTEQADRRRPRPTMDLDWWGLGSLTGSFSCIMVMGSILSAGHDGRRLAVMMLLALAFVFGLSFWWRMKHAARAIIDPDLVMSRRFAGVNYFGIVFGGGVAGMLSLLPAYYASRVEVSAVAAGSLLSVSAVCSVAMSISGAILVRRSGYRLPLVVNGVVSGVGMFMLSASHFLGWMSAGWLILSAGVVGVGSGFGDPASRNAGLHLRPNSVSEIAAIRTMCRRFGTVLSVSAATAFDQDVLSGSGALPYSFFAFGLLLVLSVFLVRLVPEHHGSW
jgi:MFS family permease